MINWIDKAYEPDEVVLSLSCTDNGYFAVVTFRHYSHMLVTSTGYVDIGIEDNRMYFREGTELTGYRLVDATYTNQKIHTGKTEITDFIEYRVGNYPLHIDETNGFHYVEAVKKGD